MLNIFKKHQPDHEQLLRNWEKEGKPFPPQHIVKQNAIREYQQLYNLNTLVESGTYLGDMVEAMQPLFKNIHSIELSEKLHKKVKKRFNKSIGIHLWLGDSGEVLHEILPKLNAPAIFWLDGHYSGGITALGNKECPVIEELNAIFNSHQPHIILIDDARLFNGTNDYPTIEKLEVICRNNSIVYQLINKDDIIRLTPAH